MRRKNTFVLATIGAMLCAATAMANDFRTRQSGDWSDSNTWEEFTGSWGTTTNIPGVGDDVLIRPSHTASVDQAVTIDSLHIADDGVVDFSAAVMLEVTDPAGFDVDPAGDGTDPGLLDINAQDAIARLSGGGMHPVEGEIFISTFVTGAALQITDSNSTFSNSSGSITLRDATAAIQIEEDVKLTIGSLFLIEGAGTIQRLSEGSNDAQFQNDSRVLANVANKELVLEAGLAVSGAGTWEVNGNGLTGMRFKQAATGLTGQFELDGGSDFHVDDDVHTTVGGDCGTSGGSIEVATGKQFIYFKGSKNEQTLNAGSHACPF